MVFLALFLEEYKRPHFICRSLKRRIGVFDINLPTAHRRGVSFVGCAYTVYADIPNGLVWWHADGGATTPAAMLQPPRLLDAPLLARPELPICWRAWDAAKNNSLRRRMGAVGAQVSFGRSC